jgi:hypothetical protein
MADVQIDAKFEGMDAVVRRFRRAPQVFERTMRRFMDRAVLVIEREVKLNFNKPRPGGQYKVNNTGAHRSSVTHEVRGTGTKMEGVVGSPLPTMPFVELDTRPHWAPLRAIEYWVSRKLRLSGAELRAAARGVQHKIARVGTRGAHVFERAFESTRERVGELWDEVWGEAVQEDL